jgi:hypothetical protein
LFSTIDPNLYLTYLKIFLKFYYLNPSKAEKDISPMDSPRDSDASTFVTPADSEHRLLEEFILDDNYINETDAGSSRPLPLLYTPAYKRTYDAIRTARIAILILSFPKFVIPIFGGHDTFIPFIPIAGTSLVLTMIPMIIVLISEFTLKNSLLQKGKSVKNKAGDKRVAVLVEDPVTGEERWMLEGKAKNDEPSVSGARGLVAGVDAWCGVVFILAIFLAILFGLD